MTKALVLLSGGQDSTTCLYWAINEYGQDEVSTVTFDYGQRHRIELECAGKIAEIAGVSNRVLPANTFEALGGNSLTDTLEVESDLDDETQLPNTFVPGRNLIFLTYAAAYAYQLHVQHLVCGVAQTDYSGYPDCRSETIEALQKAINLGMETDISIHTPLMWKSKAETVAMADELDAMQAMAFSHTCYNGMQPPCGECAACQLRAKGFEEAGVVDPLVQRFS